MDARLQVTLLKNQKEHRSHLPPKRLHQFPNATTRQSSRKIEESRRHFQNMGSKGLSQSGVDSKTLSQTLLTASFTTTVICSRAQSISSRVIVRGGANRIT